MKYFKNILVLISISAALLLSIKSGYAATDEMYNLKSITATSTQTLEIELNKSVGINAKNIESDLKVYQDRSVRDSIKDTTNPKMVEVTLSEPLTKGDSYSILSISWVEGSIEFTIGNSLENHEVQNGALDGEQQGIQKIMIVDPSTIEITFLQELTDEEFDFKVYKDIEIDSMKAGATESIIDVVLKDSLEDNSDYVWTVTLFEGGSDKIDVDSGIYDFMTDTLNKYSTKEATTTLSWESENLDDSEEESSEESLTDEQTLEETLLAALEGTSSDDESTELLAWEEEINYELNSAGEDPANRENTQLENLALSTSETPDTGAETWVLVIATFIINTFYFLSRRKKLAHA